MGQRSVRCPDKVKDYVTGTGASTLLRADIIPGVGRTLRVVAPFVARLRPLTPTRRHSGARRHAASPMTLVDAHRAALRDSPVLPVRIFPVGSRDPIRGERPSSADATETPWSCQDRGYRLGAEGALAPASPLAARWRVAAATRDFNHKVEDILRTLREAASS